MKKPHPTDTGLIRLSINEQKKPKDHFGVDGSNEWMRIANGTTALVSLRRIVSCRVKRAHLKKSQREYFESTLTS